MKPPLKKPPVELYHSCACRVNSSKSITVFSVLVKRNPLFGVCLSCVYASPSTVGELLYFDVFVMKLADGCWVYIGFSCPNLNQKLTNKTKPLFFLNMCLHVRVCMCMYACQKYSSQCLYFIFSQSFHGFIPAAPSRRWGKIIENIDHNASSKRPTPPPCCSPRLHS